MNNAIHHAIWDEAHVKALLRLLRSPFQLLQEEPWHGWIAEHGGLNAVYAYLRTAPLVPDQRALLELLLEKPHATSQAYATDLNISISTYFIRLRHLTQDLVDHLNAWSSAPPSLPAAALRPRPAPPVESPSPTTSTAPSKTFDLPFTHTSLIGAHDALATVCELIRRPATALLTLTGPGGIGKTRLATEVAKELLLAFPDGVRFVRLDSLYDPALVLIQINKVLGIHEVNDRSALEVLQSWLQNKKLLLILDNFEHLMPASNLISALLNTVSGLKLLITSRIPLRLYGEHTFQVQPLLLPDLSLHASDQELAAIPAVRLFIERARAINTSLALSPENLAAIAQICTHLDGIPLAIELAAARSNFLSPTAMLPYMQQSLSFLTYGPHDFPARHRTLRNTIDWSYTLLNEQEKALFRHLAVFSGGWTLQAAQQVAFDLDTSQEQQLFDVINLLESLFDKSLILNKKGAPCEPARFSMLETVRQYAFDRLEERGERDLLQRRHAEYYLAMLEEAEPNLVRSKQQEWIDLLEQERYNIHAALTWALAEQNADLALRMTGAIWNFWHLRSYLSEGQHWLQRAIALGTAVAPRHPALAKVFWGAAWITCLRNEWPLGERYFQEALTLATAHEDHRSIARVLQGLGYICQNRGDYDRAKEHFQTSLSICREIGDIEETAWSLDHLAAVAIDRNDYPWAQTYLAESLALFQQLGHHWATLHSLHRLGRVAFLQGNAAQGRAFCEASLKLSRTMGTTWMTPQLLTLLAQIALSQGELDEARALLTEALPLYRDVFSRNGAAVTLETLGALAAACGDYQRAAELCGAAQLLYDTSRSNKPTPYDEQQRRRLLKIIVEKLSPEVFAAAWEFGRSLSLEQLISSYE